MKREEKNGIWLVMILLVFFLLGAVTAVENKEDKDLPKQLFSEEVMPMPNQIFMMEGNSEEGDGGEGDL